MNEGVPLQDDRQLVDLGLGEVVLLHVAFKFDRVKNQFLRAHVVTVVAALHRALVVELELLADRPLRVQVLLGGAEDRRRAVLERGHEVVPLLVDLRGDPHVLECGLRLHLLERVIDQLDGRERDEQGLLHAGDLVVELGLAQRALRDHVVHLVLLVGRGRPPLLAGVVEARVAETRISIDAVADLVHDLLRIVEDLVHIVDDVDDRLERDRVELLRGRQRVRVLRPEVVQEDRAVRRARRVVVVAAHLDDRDEQSVDRVRELHLHIVAARELRDDDVEQLVVEGGVAVPVEQVVRVQSKEDDLLPRRDQAVAVLVEHRLQQRADVVHALLVELPLALDVDLADQARVGQAAAQHPARRVETLPHVALVDGAHERPREFDHEQARLVGAVRRVVEEVARRHHLRQGHALAASHLAGHAVVERVRHLAEDSRLVVVVDVGWRQLVDTDKQRGHERGLVEQLRLRAVAASGIIDTEHRRRHAHRSGLCRLAIGREQEDERLLVELVVIERPNGRRHREARGYLVDVGEHVGRRHVVEVLELCDAHPIRLKDADRRELPILSRRRRVIVEVVGVVDVAGVLERQQLPAAHRRVAEDDRLLLVLLQPPTRDAILAAALETLEGLHDPRHELDRLHRALEIRVDPLEHVPDVAMLAHDARRDLVLDLDARQAIEAGRHLLVQRDA